ncbi:unnamed protein product [Closterium sp. NIES-54]
MGKVGDALVFRVWGSRAFVCDTSAVKLSARAIPCVFLGFPPDAPGWQFYHPTSRRVFSSLDITFNESVPSYRLFPYRSAPPPPPSLFLAPGPPPVDPLPPQGLAPSGVSQVDPLSGTVPVEVALDSGAARGAVSGGAASGGAKPGGSEPGVAEPGSAECEGFRPASAEPGGAEPRGPAGASPRLSPRPEPLSSQQLCEWCWSYILGGAGVTAGAGCTGGAAAAGLGGARTRGTGAAGTGGFGGTGAEGAGAGDLTEPGGDVARGTGAGGAGAGRAGVGDTGAVGVGAGGTGAGGAGVGGARARDTGAVDPSAGGAGAGDAVSGGPGAGGTLRPRPYFVPLLQQVLGLPSSTGLTPPLLCPPPDQSQQPLQPASPLPAPSPYTEQTRGPTERREPESRPPRLFALFALLTLLLTCRLDYSTALVAESESVSPLSVEGECALGMDVLEDRQEDLEYLAAVVPRFASMLLAPEGDLDAPDISTQRSYADAITGTYVDAVPPSGANIVDGMWIFRVKRPPGSPPAFKARYVARGFSQRQGVDYFQTFSPTPKMTTLRPAGTQWSLRRPVYGLHQVPREWQGTLTTTLADLGFTPSTADPSLFLRTDTSLPPFYVIVYVVDLVFATADIEALTLVKLELQKRPTYTDLGELRSYLGLQITRDRARRTITLTQSHMVHQVLQRFGFHFSSPHPTPLSTGHSLSAPPSDYTSGMGLVLGGRGPVVLTGHADASWVDDSATQQTSQGYTFSLGSGSVSWGSTRSSSVLNFSCEAEIYAGAMAAQELRWLIYLLTNLGEQPRSPPVLYVDNKAMIAL